MLKTRSNIHPDSEKILVCFNDKVLFRWFKRLNYHPMLDPCIRIIIRAYFREIISTNLSVYTMLFDCEALQYLKRCIFSRSNTNNDKKTT